MLVAQRVGLNIITKVAAASAILVASPAIAADEKKADVYLGFAIMDWGYLNCPEGTVSRERFSLSQSMTMSLPVDKLRPLRAQVRDMMKAAGSREEACKAVKASIHEAE